MPSFPYISAIFLKKNRAKISFNRKMASLGWYSKCLIIFYDFWNVCEEEDFFFGGGGGGDIENDGY